MNVYRNTPIEYFAEGRGLSVRSLNVCRTNGIMTLGDLLRYDPEALHGLRNCGAKSAAELSALRLKYLSAPTDLFSDILRLGLQQTFLRAKERLSREQAAIIENVMGAFAVDPRAAGCFVETPYRFIDSVCNADSEMRSEILAAMARLFILWKEESSADEENVRLLDANYDYVEQLRARYQAEDIFASLPDAIKELLERRYTKRFQSLSVRTVNALSHLSDLKISLPYIFGSKILDPQKLKNAGTRTLIEMRTFLNNYKSELIEIFTLSQAQDDEWSQKVETMFVDDIAGRFGFLAPDEVRYVAMRERDGADVNPLYLLERFVMHSQSRPARIYAMRYGIGTGADKMHCADIGKSLGLSGERVRQLLSSRLTVNDEVDAMLDRALPWLDAPVVGVDDPGWQTEIDAAGLSVSIPQLMALATAVKAEYMIVRLSPESSPWLVRRDILSGVNLMTTLRLMMQTIEIKRTRTETFAIAPYIYMGKARGDFHDDVLAISRIYLDYITAIDGVTAADGQSFTVAPNKLDVIAALEDVLDGIGHPVSYSELCEEFDKANPGQLADTPRQLRSYIFRSKRIASVGRSGRYVMRHWEGVFSGTVVQCMVMELRKAGQPLTAAELHRRVTVYFPSTSVNSINVFAYLDKGRSIVMLPDRRYALAGDGYEAATASNRRSVPFAQRLDSLRLFVGEYRRLPLLSDADHVSLRRWLDNVRQGVVAVTPAQREELDRFLGDVSSLPSTSAQLSFRDHAHSVMRHVCRYGTLPTMANGRSDYLWLQRVRQAKAPYGDLRDKDRAALNNFLTNFGYKI